MGLLDVFLVVVTRSEVSEWRKGEINSLIAINIHPVQQKHPIPHKSSLLIPIKPLLFLFFNNEEKSLKINLKTSKFIFAWKLDLSWGVSNENHVPSKINLG